MGALKTKESIGEELGVSLATVNNWIKTRVLPSPDANNSYKEITYKNIMKDIKKKRPGSILARIDHGWKNQKLFFWE